MTLGIITRGVDTYVHIDYPNGSGVDADFPVTENAKARIFVSPALNPGSVRGRTVLWAQLTGHTDGDWPAQTATTALITSEWAPRSTTWNQQPTVGTTTADAVTPESQESDDPVEFDVRQHLQEIANGADYYGFRITTNSNTRLQWCGYGSGRTPFVLAYELSDAPEVPAGLVPDGGVVGRKKPVFRWQFDDPQGLRNMGGFRIQLRPIAGAIAHDTGILSGIAPEWDSATSTWTGVPTVGDEWEWRVLNVDEDGNESPTWSDWASWTWRPKPDLVIDSPADAILWDPSPTILAHLTSADLEAWRVMVTMGIDKTKILWDSNKRKATHATDIACQIPLTHTDGSRVFRDGRSYWIHVRGYTDPDRQPDGDPVWSGQWRQVTFDDDQTLVPPQLLRVEQPGVLPKVRLVWGRLEAGDAWVILRNGDPVARLDAGEPSVTGLYYAWTLRDYWGANTEATWTVKAIVNGKQTRKSNPIRHQTRLEGVWLVWPDDERWVKLRGVGVGDWGRKDRYALYKPLHSTEDVIIMDAREGNSGTFEGKLRDEPEASRAQMQLRLADMWEDAGATPMWLLAGDFAIKARIRDLTWETPSEDTHPDHLGSKVAFRFTQVGEARRG